MFFKKLLLYSIIVISVFTASCIDTPNTFYKKTSVFKPFLSNKIFLQHTAGLSSSIVQSPDNKQLAFSNRDKVLKIYSIKNKELLYSKQLTGKHTFIKYINSGKHLIIASGKIIFLLNTVNFSIIKSKSFTSKITGLASSTHYITLNLDQKEILILSYNDFNEIERLMIPSVKQMIILNTQEKQSILVIDQVRTIFFYQFDKKNKTFLLRKLFRNHFYLNSSKEKKLIALYNANLLKIVFISTENFAIYSQKYYPFYWKEFLLNNSLSTLFYIQKNKLFAQNINSKKPSFVFSSDKDINISNLNLTSMEKTLGILLKKENEKDGFIALGKIKWGKIKTPNALELIFSLNKTNISIQEQIDKANPGDTIHLGRGIYTGTLKLKSNIIIKGKGKSDTILINSKNKSNIYAENVTNVKIENCSLYNFQGNKNCGIQVKNSKIKINNTRIFNMPLTAIEASGKKTHVIINNLSISNSGTGIFLHSGAQMLIENSQIFNIVNNGISIWDKAILNITDSSIIKCSKNGLNVVNGSVLKAKKIKIDGCKNIGISSIFNSKIYLSSSDVSLNSGGGILSFNSKIVLINCNILKNTEFGLMLKMYSKADITKSGILGNNGNGLVVLKSRLNASGLKIENNLVNGLVLLNKVSILLKNSSMNSNKEYGIFSSHNSEANFENCRISYNTKGGLFSIGKSRTVIKYSSFINNQKDGLVLLNKSWVKISKSRISSNKRHGLLLQNQSLTDIAGSFINNNKRNGVIFYDSTGGLFNNTILYNNQKGIHTRDKSAIVLKQSGIYKNRIFGLQNKSSNRILVISSVFWKNNTGIYKDINASKVISHNCLFWKNKNNFYGQKKGPLFQETDPKLINLFIPKNSILRKNEIGPRLTTKAFTN